MTLDEVSRPLIMVHIFTDYHLPSTMVKLKQLGVDLHLSFQDILCAGGHHRITNTEGFAYS
jgi:hypothetical protein